jgi:mannose-1-phosphate guanylyltransferase
MIPVMNVPFLERTLLRLKAAGIDDVILPAGYLPDAITSYFGDGTGLGMKVRYVIEETPLGTAGALKNLQDLISGTFFVLNGDILTSLDLDAMIAAHRAKGDAVGSLHLIRVEDPSAFGCVVHDASGRVSAFVEKPKREEAPTNEVNAGTYLLEPEVLDFIPAGRPVSIERETFPALIAAGRPLYAFTTDDYWIDLGKPEAYLGAHRHIFDGAMPLGLRSGVDGPGAAAVPAAAIVPPVFIGRGVTVAADATVGPYTVLGDDCSVGAGARVADSLLWDGVSVGAGASIDGAIIASGARVGAGARVPRGSVIGHDADLPAGTALDENARVPATA